MGLIIKLLVLIVVAGVAAKYGLFDLLQTEVRQVAQTTGASPAEGEKLTDFSSYLSISRLYELVGSLPPPFGSWGKLALTLLLIVVAISIALAGVRLVLGMLRWFRDMLA